jgi:hypothetical protein
MATVAAAGVLVGGRAARAATPVLVALQREAMVVALEVARRINRAVAVVMDG